MIKRGYHHKGYDIYEYGWDFNYIENKSTNSMLYEDEIKEAIEKLERDENTPVTDDLNKLISIVSSEVNKVVNERKDNDGTGDQSITKETLSITPVKLADKKATAKGSISNKFIGFADGIQGSSTAEYARQAGDKANVGIYSSGDTIFVSIPGMRGNVDTRHT